MYAENKNNKSMKLKKEKKEVDINEVAITLEVDDEVKMAGDG